MTQPVPDPVFVLLSDEDAAGRIVVDLEAFVHFAAQIDASLAALEARWARRVPPLVRRQSALRRDRRAG